MIFIGVLDEVVVVVAVVAGVELDVELLAALAAGGVEGTRKWRVGRGKVITGGLGLAPWAPLPVVHASLGVAQ